MMIKISRGLDVPSTAHRTAIEDAPPPRAVAMLGGDYVGMKPTMAVQEGRPREARRPAVHLQENRGVRYTAPAVRYVSAINRGARRVSCSPW
jgi:Na+-transporting NADH:ubiquinone oxidoreductase subunit A